ncbi:MAG: Cytochrome c class [Xanthobacteraceae bacterium]|jgi:cytochrome c|nr:Cytochrome c class [Xanthobacteraceae bacterium]
MASKANGSAGLAAAFILLATTSAGAQSGDANAGKIAFNNACRTCHTLKPGDARLGPDLASIIGRKAGTGQGYNYSSAMKDAGVTWDEATLDRFIADPQAVVPNNNMKPFNGISSQQDRANLIAFLKSGG